MAADKRPPGHDTVTVSMNAVWYARGVGGAAACKINTIPARRPMARESILRRAGMTRQIFPKRQRMRHDRGKPLRSRRCGYLPGNQTSIVLRCDAPEPAVFSILQR